MKLTTFSIRNPLIVGAITVVLALFGIYAYVTMGIGLLPNFSELVVPPRPGWVGLAKLLGFSSGSVKFEPLTLPDDGPTIWNANAPGAPKTSAAATTANRKCPSAMSASQATSQSIGGTIPPIPPGAKRRQSRPHE